MPISVCLFLICSIFYSNTDIKRYVGMVLEKTHFDDVVILRRILVLGGQIEKGIACIILTMYTNDALISNISIALFYLINCFLLCI